MALASAEDGADPFRLCSAHGRNIKNDDARHKPGIARFSRS
jgi:hypothetical protein